MEEEAADFFVQEKVTIFSLQSCTLQFGTLTELTQNHFQEDFFWKLIGSEYQGPREIDQHGFILNTAAGTK